MKKERKIPFELLPDSEATATHFARYLADFIKLRNRQNLPTRLILPVGPVKPYPILTKIINKEKISLKNVHTFNMDEYLDWQGRPIGIDHPLSFEGFMDRFFQSIDEPLRPPKHQVHFPTVFDLDGISERIDEAGGIDLCLGGVGVHGHVAFNEPIVSRFQKVSIEEFKASKTRILPLAPETVVMNSIRANGGDFEDFPPMAITLGMKDILKAAKIRLYCDGGSWQRESFYRAVYGDQGVRYPVTLLQEHEDVAMVATEDTAWKVINEEEA
ncbi:glucosamine-6-phosphate isomerase [Thalassobacillus devorans]|uniref:Glucosamine-6-phosphate isomerase n=1 Tax=Thalassobacillus devorans TaxID=279813 RepID=A0ABQ1NUA5_9BACI|nr:hypothetical protein [Thalassobacillus devorans]NIK28558.1 glucosamine-6-phosphate deaminase [Thalassobacillus devorans]GGC85290.1 glucosamine-6-phosphate isomerase [Thalassobacillus devorans]